ncbi:MAG: restriction endonuclease, partial [Christensenellales bacterium]
KKMSRDRSILARALDFIILRAAILLAAYLVLYQTLRHQAAALLLALLAVLLFSVAAQMVNNIRLERFKEKHIKLLRKKYLEESLVLLPSADFLKLCAAFIRETYGIEAAIEPDGSLHSPNTIITARQLYGNQKTGVQAILDLYQSAQKCGAKQAVLLCTTRFDEEALSIARRIPGLDIHIAGLDELVAYSRQTSYAPHDEEIRERLQEDLQKQPLKLSDLRKKALSTSKAKRYLLIGVLLILVSFLTGYRIYYQIVAAICVTLAALSFTSAHLAQKNS